MQTKSSAIFKNENAKMISTDVSSDDDSLPGHLLPEVDGAHDAAVGRGHQVNPGQSRGGGGPGGEGGVGEIGGQRGQRAGRPRVGVGAEDEINNDNMLLIKYLV